MKNISSKKLTLIFFLLILEISLNFSLNANHKYYKFSQILLEKNFKFVLSKKTSIIAF